MIVGTEDSGGVRLPPEALDTLLEAAGDDAALRAAGRRTGEEIARRAGSGTPWSSLTATWSECGLGSLRRERPADGVWVLALDGPAGASAPARTFWEGVLGGLLGALAGEPVGIAALPSGIGSEARFVTGAPETVERLRRGLSAGWTLERILEGA